MFSFLFIIVFGLAFFCFFLFFFGGSGLINLKEACDTLLKHLLF